MFESHEVTMVPTYSGYLVNICGNELRISQVDDYNQSIQFKHLSPPREKKKKLHWFQESKSRMATSTSGIFAKTAKKQENLFYFLFFDSASDGIHTEIKNNKSSHKKGKRKDSRNKGKLPHKKSSLSGNEIKNQKSFSIYS